MNLIQLILEGITYKIPNFNFEWEEAIRYPEFKKLGKQAWISIASKGKGVSIDSAKDISNTDANKPGSFKLLDKDKQKRTLLQIKSGTVEMPIIAVYPDGHKELLGGNTRLTALMHKNGKATVWMFDVPEDISTSLNEDLTLSPFDYDQDGNESRIKRDINNKKGWRRLGSKSSQNIAIKKYLDKYTSGYKWSNPPKSEKFSDENDKMYKTPYIMYVHLLQTSEGKNNIIDALSGMAVNEPDNTMKKILQALFLVFSNKEDQFKKVYTQYKSMIEKNANDDSGANPFAALKYASENFNNKVEIFNKFVRNGWSAGKFNLNEAIVGDKIVCDNCGWEWKIKDGGDDLYMCHKCDHNNTPTALENFKDGKKKGKSKPGRVKKSGASCNGSVTDLRKKAKNASGEKAKMYHWCANMKGGKKK